MKMFEDLSMEELKKVVKSYNNYVMTFREEHDIDSEPVSIYEYYNNDYQLERLDDYKQTIIEMVETEYEGCENDNYDIIMQNIDMITQNVLDKLNDNTDLEEELKIIWEEIDRTIDTKFCLNCGREKEDYECAYCDKCYEEEFEEEYVEILKCVAVKDLKDNNGLKIILIGENENIINTFEFDIDIKRLNEMELYRLCYSISNRVNSLYYENKGNVEREQVLSIVREEVIK